MRKGRRLKSVAYSVGTGAFAVFLFLLFYFALNRNTAPFMLILREVFPIYDEGIASVVSLYAYGGWDEFSGGGGYGESEAFDSIPDENSEDSYGIRAIEGYDTVHETFPGDLEENTEIPYIPPDSGSVPPIIGIKDVIYQPGTDITINDNSQTEIITTEDIVGMSFNDLKSRLYTVDKRTDLLETDIQPNDFLDTNFKINTEAQGPKVLIFHTHSQEAYVDSAPGDFNDGVLAVGDRLRELLETKYGIETLHDKSRYDVVNGESQTLGAYERMEPSVKEILNKYPSIELVIDLHRDGVPENVKFVTEINGKPTAKIMFFNGLCRVYQNGSLSEISGLPNRFVKDNLALSFKLQLLANEFFPDFTRKIYINAYRYSLHFKPKSLLVEVGAQTNTKEEALNAMEPLAEILAKTIK